MAGQGSAERVILGNRGQRVWAFMHAGLWVNTSYLGMWKEDLKKIWRIAPSGIDGYNSSWVELMAVICTKWRWADRKEGCVEVMIIRWEHTHTHTPSAAGTGRLMGCKTVPVQVCNQWQVCNGDMQNVQLVVTLLFLEKIPEKFKRHSTVYTAHLPFD